MSVATLSSSDVIRSLVRLELLDGAQIASITQDPSNSVEDIGRVLIQQNWLTHFQWARVTKGRAEDLVFGQYIIRDEIGRGGTGVVYKARHKTMKRIVALKTLRHRSTPDEEDVARFHREVEMMAKLDHPNIVTAFDAGLQDGIPYFVMEWVDGTDLSSLVHRRGPLPISDCMGYLIQAASGLHAAHEQRIIHRDVKPANLMVRKDGAIKVLDLGLAKLSHQMQGDGSSLTGADVIMGTPAFLAPEQAMDFRTADHRADIYSLGCTLYFLLTGELMYAEQSGMAMIQAHLHQAIPRLSDFRADADTDLQQLFAWMVAKQPENRPSSMKHVIDGLQTVTTSHPFEQPVALATDQQPTRALGRKKKKPSSATLPKPAGERPELTTHTEAAPQKSTTRRRILRYGGIAFLLAYIIGAIALLFVDRTPSRRAANGQIVSKLLNRFSDHTDKVQAVAVSDDGRLIASCGDDAVIYVYERQSGKKKWALRGHKNAVHDIDFSPDGMRLASGGFAGAVCLWDLATGRMMQRTANYTARVFDVEFSNDGRILFSSSEDRTIAAWDGRTLQPKYSLAGQYNWVYPLAVLPEETQIACGDFGGELRIWNVCKFTGRKTHRVLGRHKGAVYTVALPPNDSSVAVSAGEDGNICVWSIPDARKIKTLKGHDGAIEKITFTPDGRWMASGGRDGRILIWDWPKGQIVHRIEKHTAAVHSLAFAPDGRTLISGSYDHTVCTWRLQLP